MNYRYFATFTALVVFGATLLIAFEWTDSHYTEHRWFVPPRLALIRTNQNLDCGAGRHFPEVAYTASALFPLYFMLLVGSRIATRGMSGFFDAFWACNFCLLLCSFGIWMHLPSLLSASVTLLSFEHFTFAIDCMAYWVTGKFPLGMRM